MRYQPALRSVKIREFEKAHYIHFLRFCQLNLLKFLRFFARFLASPCAAEALFRSHAAVHARALQMKRRAADQKRRIKI